ncbi:hypothetical protein DRH29_00395 [candidate division Kazan bacterium]|uniref:Glycosyl transferase family 1 domain-containing protein n=1 Tax=candidate division Kazan bacterium TaxID=2202143 RepID=A0A420ZE33_UNCK3|nr:MAG: hypothetical protein DRH29_00395 [candidate division Kazan bacterium]
MILANRPKKIGVDGSALVKSNPTGVEKATAEILLALFRLDVNNRYFIYAPSQLPDKFKNFSNVVARVMPSQRFWTQTALPRAIMRDNLDVFWSPSNILPPKLPPKSLATIYDVAFVKYPECYSWWSRILQRASVLRAKSLATRIITITQNTKEDLRRYFNMPASQIDIVPMARPTQAASAAKLPPKWKNYILAVGRVEHKKNSLNIVKAFEKLSAKYSNLHLVFAGPAGYGFGEIKKRIDNSSQSHNIHLLGFVSGEELNSLYRNAKLLLTPSLYEGFGLTILEGFAADIPVVTSDIGAMKEVAGNAAVLVNPHDAESIMSGVDRLLSGEAARRRCISAGRERLRDFSWEKSASKIRDIISSL